MCTVAGNCLLMQYEQSFFASEQHNAAPLVHIGAVSVEKTLNVE